MKKLATAIVIGTIMLGALSAHADIATRATHAAVVIAASGVSTSAAIDLSKLRGHTSGTIRPDGYFSAQVLIAGTGTASVTYTMSNDGVTYVTPTGATAIATGLTVGTTLQSFSPPVAKYLKVVVTETGGATGVTVTVTLAIQ